jgi:cellulose biosynthesis protein BcsQ
MEKNMAYGISTYKVNELAETLGINKASVSEKLKASPELVQKNEVSNRIIGIQPEAVQDYFLARGYSSLYTKTVIIGVQSCSGGIGKSSIALGLLSAARRIKARHETVIDGIKISPACVFCDFDSQHSSTLSLLGKPQDDDKPVLKHYLNNEAELDEILVPLGDEVYLIPSNLQNLYLDKVLNSVQAIKNGASKLISDLEKKFGRGFVLIQDSPPALSNFNQSFITSISQLDKEKYNATLVSPIRSLDRYGIKASEITINEAKEICEAFNLPKPKILTFLTMYNRVGKTSVEILKQVLENPTLKETLIDNVVRYSSEFSKSNLSSTSIFNGKQTPATEDINSLFLTLFGYEKPERGNA